ncbi:MAG: phage tail sheath C-terminal domain-containing protein [Oscillospiraceae bacterium]
MVTDNMRPGVYSSYTVTSRYAAPRSPRGAALICGTSFQLAEKTYRLTSYGQAAELFSAASSRRALECCRILFENGVSPIWFSMLDRGYGAALNRLAEEDEIGAVITDCTGPLDVKAMMESVEESCGKLHERLIFFGIGEVALAMSTAKAVNSERAVVCCPGVSPISSENRAAIYGACALAGRVLANNDPVYNYNGCVLDGVETPDKLAEDDIQQLLAGGVTVLEEVGGQVECVRAVTTRTLSNGAEDNSMRPLNTILIIDDVLRGIRQSLRARLRGAKLAGQSFASVASQVTVELAAKQDDGIITGFDAPSVYAHSADPTVCVVELAFRVANVIGQIHITAHVQV